MRKKNSVCIFLFLLFNAQVSFSQGMHEFNLVYTPALTQVNISNFSDFTINSFNEDLFLRQRPNTPDYGYRYGLSYQYKFDMGFSIGIGLFKSSVKSNSDEFYLYETSKAKTFYSHEYNSLEIPIMVGYFFTSKRIQPFIRLDAGPAIFKKFKMAVYSVNNETGKRNNFLTETHFGIKYSLINISAGVSAGVRIKIYKLMSLSFSPEYRYYSKSMHYNCPDCSSFIKGNIWLLGINCGVIASF